MFARWALVMLHFEKALYANPEQDLNKLWWDIVERYQLSIYDAMIVSAALQSNCATLWSEDLHNGLVIEERLTVRNPFH